jgi:hypothetical protein
MFRRRPRQNLPLDLVALRRAADGADYSAREAPGPSAGLPPDFQVNQERAASGSIFNLSSEQLEKLLVGIWRRGNLIIQPFSATNVAPIQIRPQESRFYCFIQNQSGLNQISVNFGRPAGPLGIVPVDGIVIAPNFGFYEPIMVPQDSISVMAAGVNTPGIIIYSNLPLAR